MKQFILIVLMLASATVFAQTSDENTNYGTITINQDPRIAELVNTHIEINKANNGKILGWRVQIYNSSGTNSRTEVQNARKLFLSKYPDVGAYLIYQPPFFKIRVGDFRSKDEAYSFYKQILADFPVSYLISDQINYPALKTPEDKVTTDLNKMLEEIR
ncbi:MAG: SPOR domain-containing protein [Bacteroidales bacterium]|nr:SPOR domain-containing protein [Bacteroidales bacterium]